MLIIIMVVRKKLNTKIQSNTSATVSKLTDNNIKK